MKYPKDLIKQMARDALKYWNTTAVQQRVTLLCVLTGLSRNEARKQIEALAALV